MSRADLLALTPDGLAALANRGLVKRATKDLDAGALPTVDLAEDGTLTGRFPDGVTTVLAPGAGLDAGTCSCAAPGVCRHRIGLVLAYQRSASAEAEAREQAPAEFRRWSPGAFTDEALTEAFGARTIATARRSLRAGYVAAVHRPSERDTRAGVELAACTVWFLVPDELGYVDTDAAAAKRAENIVLAVWAFRAADAADPDAPLARVEVGGAAEDTGSGLDAATALVDQVLDEGVAHAGPVLVAGVRRLADDLDARNLRWPVAALEEFADQLTAYAERTAAYHSARIADLAAEIHGRHRAVSAGGAGLRSRVLGTEERAESPLRRVRLVGLGARVSAVEDERQVEVYLADPVGGTVLVLRRSWDDGPTGQDIAGRRVAGTTIAALATSNVVSEAATRSAGREVRVSRGGLAKTAVTPLHRAWEGLPATVAVPTIAALSEELADMPPRVVRPRVAAEFVRVLPVARVLSVAYHPGAQRLRAEIADAEGTVAAVVCDYRAVSPGALDALAVALAQEPTHLSGTVRRVGGVVVVDPIAVGKLDMLTVLDLAPSDTRTTLGPGGDDRRDPLVVALDDGLEVLAEGLHRGLRSLPAGYADRVARACRGLTDVGLHRCAGALTAFGTARTPAAWVDAHLRLSTTAEYR